MFKLLKLLPKPSLLLLCFILLCITIVLCYENREINLGGGGGYYLSQFSPDEKWYFLHSRQSKEHQSMPPVGIIDYYKTKDYYILHGLSIKLCDKQGLYYLWHADKYYYVINRHSDGLDILKGDQAFEIFSNTHNLELKSFSIPEAFVEKIRRSHVNAGKDGCLYDEIQ